MMALAEGEARSWPLPLGAWASPVSASWAGSPDGNKAFTGREWDGETGLYYYRARYYDPILGRFVSEDPLRLHGGLNLYTYVAGNPSRFRDPLGLHETGTQAAFGETAGLYPQQLPGATGPAFDPTTWDPASYHDLQQAREAIADISDRNQHVRRATPRDPNNPIERRAWNSCDLADSVADTWDLPDDVRHFYVRQDGEGAQKPSWAEGMEPYMSFGPFVNVGGGDVPGGGSTYVDIYRGVR